MDFSNFKHCRKFYTDNLNCLTELKTQICFGMMIQFSTSLLEEQLPIFKFAHFLI